MNQRLDSESAEDRVVMITVVADENIPAIDRALPDGVEVQLMSGRGIDARSVSEADALLVRSVTRVDGGLLEGSRVRFVASATAGLDHVDREWLEKRGIAFAWAAGSNAESVAEYVAAALLHAAARQGKGLEGRRIGIVGVGQCGSRVERAARAMGMEVLLCDPPLARESGRRDLLPLERLAGAEFVTLHVPLTDGGADRTRGMISREFIEAMGTGAVLINASRGGVVDEEALVEALEAGRIGGAVIDAWEGEPRIRKPLLERAVLGTPHIAGYSTDAKYRGTAMVVAALAEHFGLASAWTPAMELEVNAGMIEAGGGSLAEQLGRAVQSAYPIERDDAQLRATLGMTPEAAAAEFDRLRREYPVRREFGAFTVKISMREAALRTAAEGLGFRVVEG